MDKDGRLQLPSARKQRILKKRKSRRGLYILGAVVVIVTLAGVGWYLYASAQSAALNAVVYAKLNTTQGLIEVELYQGRTPKTVSNFVSLAQTGFYNQLVWHRIATNPFVIQTGDPNTRNGGGNRTYVAGECCYWGSGGSSQTVPLEIDSSLHNVAGTLGMARGSDKNSGTSQFYINIGDNTSLDGQYTVFGKIISGMDSATAISRLHVSNEQPLDPLPFLRNVTISNTA